MQCARILPFVFHLAIEMFLMLVFGVIMLVDMFIYFSCRLGVLLYVFFIIYLASHKAMSGHARD